MKCRVHFSLPRTPSNPFLRGYQDVDAGNMLEAIDRAKIRIKQTHGGRDVRIRNVEMSIEL